MTRPTVLTVEGLCTDLSTPTGVLRAVDGVSFQIAAGETLGLVGESGCGKSVTALSIMQLLPQRVGRIAAGRIELAGHGDLARKSQSEMRRIRGATVSMIFQEPMTSLNPVYRVGYQVAEAVLAHRSVGTAEAWNRAVEMFRLVGIPDPEGRARDYPHKLSGGLRQRVMIAMAMACGPALLLADEPTTALDVSIQAQILTLMKRVSAETGTATLLITHDMGVIARMAQRVVVMYAGVIVETALVLDLFDRPSHPYTVGLLGSIPRHDSSQPRSRRTRLQAIGGMVPNLRHLPPGCRFSDRCTRVHDRCRASEPPLFPVRGSAPGHQARCWLLASGDAA
jgi:oligopeptide/dipeptide ABC transporter ATP-binding protein